MRKRLDGRCLLVAGVAVALGACLQLEPEAGGADVVDGGAALGSGADAGPGRPATAEELPLPDCGGTTPGGGGLALDGGVAVVDGAVVGAGAGGGSGGVGATGGRRPTRFGEVVISELMVDPAAVSDTQGEWIELHNPTDTTFDLQGCVVDDGGSTARALADPFGLAPGGFKAIARAASAGFAASATMAMSLGNTGDSVAVLCDGVEIDRVVYGPGFPLASGKSMALDPSALDAMSNDAPNVWCLATEPYGFDFGTPGKPNADCFDASEDAGM